MEQVFVNGDLEHRVPHNLNMSFNFVEGESLIMGIKGLAVSSGSACTSASLEPSYVLRALGRSDELAHSSLRMTIGRFTTEEEIDYAPSHHPQRAKLREPPVGDVQGRRRSEHHPVGRTERSSTDILN
jgi:cysteine desulfurase